MPDKIEQLLANILEELKADADECEYYRQNGNAGPANFDMNVYIKSASGNVPYRLWLLW